MQTIEQIASDALLCAQIARDHRTKAIYYHRQDGGKAVKPILRTCRRFARELERSVVHKANQIIDRTWDPYA